MPHTMFFDMHGHAIHGFFDVKHLGSPVSHGCVRLAPANAATLFALVQGQGMSQTTVVVSGQAPARGGEEMARRRPPVGYEPAPPPPGYFLPPRSSLRRVAIIGNRGRLNDRPACQSPNTKDSAVRGCHHSSTSGDSRPECVMRELFSCVFVNDIGAVA
jgi:L,D-transpeptidase catalytic domain